MIGDYFLVTRAHVPVAAAQASLDHRRLPA